MSKIQQYTQVLVRRQTDQNMIYLDVIWIPTQLSKVGQVLKLKSKKDNTWIDGWVVYSRYNTISREEADQITSDHRDFSSVLK